MVKLQGTLKSSSLPFGPGGQGVLAVLEKCDPAAHLDSVRHCKARTASRKWCAPIADSQLLQFVVGHLAAGNEAADVHLDQRRHPDVIRMIAQTSCCSMPSRKTV